VKNEALRTLAVCSTVAAGGCGSDWVRWQQQSEQQQVSESMKTKDLFSLMTQRIVLLFS
jgi:hypothetical protein